MGCFCGSRIRFFIGAFRKISFLPRAKAMVIIRQFDKKRYCFWLTDAGPDELKKSPILMQRLANVREMRMKSSAAPTRAKADTPQLFFFVSQPKTDYLLIPSTSSQRRRYIPIGFLSPDIIASNVTDCMSCPQTALLSCPPTAQISVQKTDCCAGRKNLPAFAI